MSTKEKIYNYIVEYISDKGYSPTIREIGEEIGIGSTSTIHWHLTRLKNEGLIYWEEYLHRSIRLKDETIKIEKIKEELSHIDRTPIDDGGYSLGVIDGIDLAIRTIDKYFKMGE